MSRQNRIVNKKIKKLQDRVCLICGEPEMSLLDVHRIVYGAKYSKWNTITCCVRCHRLIHGGQIKIVGKYPSTTGTCVVSYFDQEGKEVLKESF